MQPCKITHTSCWAGCVQDSSPSTTTCFTLAAGAFHAITGEKGRLGNRERAAGNMSEKAEDIMFLE